MSQKDILLAVTSCPTTMAAAGRGISVLSAAGQTIVGIFTAAAPIL